MPNQDTVDTERTVVTTYVPSYQKSQWETHADGLDMSLSEFVRSMVQAGRRGFDPESNGHMVGENTGIQTSDVEETGSTDATPRVDTRKLVIQTLEEDGPLTGEEIVDGVLDEWRSDIAETLETLQNQGVIQRPALGNEFELVEE